MTWVEPIMTFAPPEDWSSVDDVIDHFDDIDWLVFVSRPGVRYFWQRVWERGFDARSYRGKIASIGPGSTEELSRFHLHADYEASENRAEGLSREMRDAILGKRVVILHADRGRQILETDWREISATVRSVVCYRQIDSAKPSAELLEILGSPGEHWIFLTSGNVARQFSHWLASHPTIRRDSLRFISIGPACSTAANEVGLKPHLQAGIHTPDGMVDVLLEHVGKESAPRDY